MRNKRAAAWLGSAMVVALLATSCGGAPAVEQVMEGLVAPTSQPTAAPARPVAAVPFAGRLLLERFVKDGAAWPSTGLYEYASGMEQPVAAEQPRPQPPIAVSPDGRYAVVTPHNLEDRQTGASFPLPMDASHDDPEAAVSAAFSPAGRHLAYTVTSKTASPALFVLDLAAQEVQRIHDGACARYSAVRICTYLSEPVWAGPGALAFMLNDAGLPAVIKAKGGPDPRDSNRLNLITPQGRTVLTLAEPATDIPRHLRKVGDTIFFERLSDEGFWLAAGELAGGVWAPHALPAGVLVDAVAPDGRYVLWPGQPWRLLEVRTGQELRLGTRTDYPLTAFTGCLWSTDQTAVACGTYTSLVVAPLSDAAGGVVFTWNFEAERWSLRDWLP